MRNYLEQISQFPYLDLGMLPGTKARLIALAGGGHVESSFKHLLAYGLIKKSLEQNLLQPGQPVIESSSGSMGVGLAAAGKVLGNPIIVVSDQSIPQISACKINHLGAQLVKVDGNIPLGAQQARENQVKKLLKNNPDYYFLNQNNNPLNPQVYTDYLIPKLATQLNPKDFVAAIFAVGSGGHFSALSHWLKTNNPQIKTIAVDRPGSMTFFSEPHQVKSHLRGIGNSNCVPKVIANHLHLVDDVIRTSDAIAFQACHHIALQHQIFVGGSSGAVYAAALEWAQNSGVQGNILTLFPDRGELYYDTIFNQGWLNEQQISA